MNGPREFRPGRDRQGILRDDAKLRNRDRAHVLAKLPPGWVWMRVHEVGDIQLGRQRAPKHHHGPHMRPYLRVANVFEDRLALSDVMEMNFEPHEYETYRLEPGDILLNEGQSIELVGRPAMFRGELPDVCFQNTLVRFRASPLIDARFALLVFRGYLHTGRFQQIAQWTVNIAHLGAGRFADLEFPLPPITEQRRIVAECEKQFSRLDAGVAALKRVQANLRRYRAAVLQAACEGRLVPTEAELARAEGREYEPADCLLTRIVAERRSASDTVQAEGNGNDGRSSASRSNPKYREPAGYHAAELPTLPKGWSWSSLDTICPVFVDCAHRTPRLSSEGIPALRPRDVVNGILDLENAVRVSREEYEQQTLRRMPQAGDLIYSRELSFGWVVEVPERTQLCLGQGMVLFRPHAEFSQKYLRFFINGPHGRQQSAQAATGSAHPHINLGDIRSFAVPVPPASEQRRIVAELERSLSIIDEMEMVVRVNLQRAERLRQSILQRAFEGKLVPQDADDEPAGVLLERIRGEREGAVDGGVGKRGRGRGASREGQGALDLGG